MTTNRDNGILEPIWFMSGFVGVGWALALLLALLDGSRLPVWFIVLDILVLAFAALCWRAWKRSLRKCSA